MKQTKNVDVGGMYCAACAARIEKVVAKMEGVSAISVNLATEKGRITFYDQQTDLAAIIQKINKIGYHAELANDNYKDTADKKRHEIRKLQNKFFLSAGLTFPLAWAMLAHFQWLDFIYVPDLLQNPWFQLAVTFPIQFMIGFQFYEGAWKAVKSRTANMDVLVVLSTSAAFFYSHYATVSTLQSPDASSSLGMFYETSAFIITFILLGKLLEAKTKLKTTAAIKKLSRLQTNTATLLKNGTETTVTVDQIVPGHVVMLKPGEKAPIDGQVLEGASMIDESLLTGESIPVEKRQGSDVYAGTINQHGTLTIKVTKSVSDTALSQIIRIVEDAQASKPPIQRTANKITEVFVPIVMTLALLTFALWYMVLQPGELNEALEKVIAVLIIACPCALGLATPTSIMVGSGRAAQSGILFKEGKFLELLGKNNMIIFDKTGTITNGEPEVTDIMVDRLSEDDFLQIAGAVERTVRHPIAEAIMKRAQKQIQPFPKATNVQFIPGSGITAFVNGKKVTMANPKYFKKHHVFIPAKDTNLVERLEKEGKTVMVVMIDGRFTGILAVADKIKTSSYTTISQLKKMGMDVRMLTGDNEHTAKKVTKKIGIPQYLAEVTPQDKATMIQQLQQEGNRVIMVGDGINDAPALTIADVGIAIGTGSDVAVESGDVTVIKSDLHRIVETILISKKTVTNIKQNFLWAFFYNIIMIPVAMLGFLAPWLAGAAMAFSSVSVVLNALRLKRINIL